MADAIIARDQSPVRVTVAAAVASGECRQLKDGRAAVYKGLNAASSGDQVSFETTGQFTMAKTAGFVALNGGRAYWDHSANAVYYKPTNDRDFYVGTFVADAASADTECTVNLNVEPTYEIELIGSKTADNIWTTEATNGLGVTPMVGGGVQLAFDAVAEAAQAACYAVRTFPKTANAIVEFKLTYSDNGDNSALDWDVGIANASHATDFDAITEFCSVHSDGNALDLYAQSDDGTTDTALTDTTVNLVEGTAFEVWFDMRDESDIQIYVDGSLVLAASTFTLGAATGPFFPIIHMEKTADDTSADLRCHWCRVRIAEQ